MKISFLNVPEWAHLGEYRCNGVVWQGQVGVFNDSTGRALTSSTDATWTMYEDRNYVKAIDSTTYLQADSTGQVEFFIIYKWPNVDEYEDADRAYGQKILHNTPVVCVPLIPGFIIEDYDTQDNTSGIDSGVDWTLTAPGDAMYINAAGRWTTTHNEWYGSMARARFVKYQNQYVTYRITEPSNHQVLY